MSKDYKYKKLFLLLPCM